MDNKLAVAEFAGAGISLYTVGMFIARIVFNVADATGQRLGSHIYSK